MHTDLLYFPCWRPHSDNEHRIFHLSIWWILHLKTAKEMVSYVNSFYGPRFDTLRWVPLRYRSMLPLDVMKRYQCIVVGATQRELTVAFTAEQNKVVIRTLKKLTDLDIFPVLVQPAKFRLLMHRIEAYEQHRHDLDWPYYVHWYFTHSIVAYILAEQVLHKQQIVEEPWEYE